MPFIPADKHMPQVRIPSELKTTDDWTREFVSGVQAVLFDQPLLGKVLDYMKWSRVYYHQNSFYIHRWEVTDQGLRNKGFSTYLFLCALCLEADYVYICQDYSNGYWEYLAQRFPSEVERTANHVEWIADNNGAPKTPLGPIVRYQVKGNKYGLHHANRRFLTLRNMVFQQRSSAPEGYWSERGEYWREKIRSFGYFCLKYTTRVSEQPVCPYVLEISRLVQKIKKIVGEVKVSWIGKVSEYLKHAYATQYENNREYNPLEGLATTVLVDCGADADDWKELHKSGGNYPSYDSLIRLKWRGVKLYDAKSYYKANTKNRYKKLDTTLDMDYCHTLRNVRSPSDESVRKSLRICKVVMRATHVLLTAAHRTVDLNSSFTSLVQHFYNLETASDEFEVVQKTLPEIKI